MPKKNTGVSGVDHNSLKVHLQSIDDMSEDDGYEASNGSQALEQVRRMFYGTPFEQVLTDAIVICDAVHDRAKEIGS